MLTTIHRRTERQREAGGDTCPRAATIFELLDEGDLETLHNFLSGYPDVVHARDKYGMTPLHWVTNVAQAESFLWHRADANARSDYGSTPLHVAARHGRTEVAVKLLDHGADVQAKDQISRTPLHLAAAAGHVEIVSLLMSNVVDVKGRDRSGSTPLELALRNGHTQIAILLRQRGATL